MTERESNMETNKKFQHTPIYQRAVTPTATDMAGLGMLDISVDSPQVISNNGIVRGKALYYHQPLHEAHELTTCGVRPYHQHPRRLQNLSPRRHNSETELPPNHTAPDEPSFLKSSSVSGTSPSLDPTTPTENDASELTAGRDRVELLQAEQISIASHLVPLQLSPTASVSRNGTSALSTAILTGTFTCSSSPDLHCRDSIRLVPCTAGVSKTYEERYVDVLNISENISAMSLQIAGDNWVWQWGDTDSERELLNRVVEVSLERVPIEIIMLRFLAHAKHLMNVKRLILGSNGIESLSQLRDIISCVGAGNGPGTGRLAQLTVTDNPVCLCSYEVLQAFLIQLVPSLRLYNDSDLLSSHLGKSVAVGSITRGISTMSPKESDVCGEMHSFLGVALRIPKKSLDGTLSSSSHVKRGNAANIAFPDHSSSEIESHSKFMSECGRVAMSVRTAEEKFRDIFEEWMRKTIFETIESMRPVEQRHTT